MKKRKRLLKDFRLKKQQTCNLQTLLMFSRTCFTWIRNGKNKNSIHFKQKKMFYNNKSTMSCAFAQYWKTRTCKKGKRIFCYAKMKSNWKIIKTKLYHVMHLGVHNRKYWNHKIYRFFFLISILTYHIQHFNNKVYTGVHIRIFSCCLQ